MRILHLAIEKGKATNRRLRVVDQYDGRGWIFQALKFKGEFRSEIESGSEKREIFFRILSIDRSSKTVSQGCGIVNLLDLDVICGRQNGYSLAVSDVGNQKEFPFVVDGMRMWRLRNGDSKRRNKTILGLRAKRVRSERPFP